MHRMHLLRICVTNWLVMYVVRIQSHPAEEQLNDIHINEFSDLLEIEFAWLRHWLPVGLFKSKVHPTWEISGIGRHSSNTFEYPESAGDCMRMEGIERQLNFPVKWIWKLSHPQYTCKCWARTEGHQGVISWPPLNNNNSCPLMYTIVFDPARTWLFCCH